MAVKNQNLVISYSISENCWNWRVGLGLQSSAVTVGQQWLLVCDSTLSPSGRFSLRTPSPNTPTSLVGSGAPQPHPPNATPSLYFPAMALAPKSSPSPKTSSTSLPPSKVSSIPPFYFFYYYFCWIFYTVWLPINGKGRTFLLLHYLIFLTVSHSAYSFDS